MTMGPEPFGGTLVYLGDELGYRFREGESSPEYVKRVFGVDLGEIKGPVDPLLGG